jgi:uncharacterized protein (TIGR00251 family)
MIQIDDHADGCVLSVRAQPGARRNAIVGEQAGALKVAVTAPPDKGRANDAIVEALAESFGLKRSQVELLSGATNRQKKFLIHGMSGERLRSLIDALAQSER